MSDSLEERFWMKVDSGGECWEWTGACNPRGYGKIGNKDKSAESHRVSWELHRGPVPDGLCVLHRCDNRKCVRPDHLFLGTNKENMDDKVAKGRQARPKGEANGQAKLRESDILAIREMHRRHKRRARVARGLNRFLSRWFGVATQTVYEAACGTTWRAA